jgi:PAS domain S-box-containing protein
VSRTLGECPEYQVIAFDVTERKSVEEALGASQRFSRALMESAPIGILLADEEGRCTYVNRRWSECTGLRLRPAILPGWESAVAPEERVGVTEAWRSYVAGQASEFQKEFRYRRPDGSEAYVLASAIRLEGPARHQARFLRVEQDLTELRRSQQLLDEHRIKMVAAAKLTALGEMAGGVAHEVNNPLAIIHGNADLLRIWAQTGEINQARLVELSETITATSRRIAKIVRALRTISRNAEHDPPEPALVGALLDQVVSLSAARARDERILLKVDPVPPHLAVSCRPAQVSQIILNLLNNAFYACSEGERWVHVEVRELEKQVEIAVIDGGPGVSSGKREKLFQPFFTTKPVGVGTGLGLSIAAALAAGHGGSLTFDESHPRTRFVLTLPKASPEEALREYHRAQ